MNLTMILSTVGLTMMIRLIMFHIVVIIQVQVDSSGDEMSSNSVNNEFYFGKVGTKW